MASLKGATSLVEPPRWSDECLETDRARAIAAFREERLKEPVEAYTDQFEIARDAFDDLLETTVDFTLLAQNAMEVLSEAKFLEAVRYVASPPISEDDLKTLAETDSLAKKAIKADPEEEKSLYVFRHVYLPSIEASRQPSRRTLPGRKAPPRAHGQT